MKYPKEYFQKEIIDGFEVSSMMKRCWAAQMEVLEIFDAMCRKYSVKYFLAYGTLLGAVRHGGFIPWDDDIDIWMLPEDLDRLIQESSQDAEEAGLIYLTPFSEGTCEVINMAYRLNNSKYTYCLKEDFLKKYWLFPFVAGIDIFTLNYLPRDNKKKEELLRFYNAVSMLGHIWNDPGLSETDKMAMYMQITEMFELEPVEKDQILRHLWQIADRIGQTYGADESDMVAELSYYAADSTKEFKKEWFDDIEYISFEGLKFPCPAAYKEVLTVEFGNDYMTPQFKQGDHEYPYYKSVHKEMLENFAKAGVSCPDIYLAT